MRMMTGLLVVLFTLISGNGLQADENKTEQKNDKPTHAVLHTSEGDITFELFWEQAPLAVENFVGLARGTKEYLDPETKKPTKGNFFDGVIFHRVISGFMIQTGDPLGTGRGGPGYQFPNESSNLSFDQPGRLGMANAGRDTNGSQFFITVAPTPHLDGGYTIWGQVTEGMDVVQKIATTRTGPGDRPVEEIRIERVSFE